MTNFVHCRGCGIQIHETALSCPQCGAQQNLAPVSQQVTHVGVTAKARDLSDYSQVPFFRKRWFIVCCLLIFTPVAGLLAATGDLYYSHKGEVKIFPKSAKVTFILLSVAWIAFNLLRS